MWRRLVGWFERRRAEHPSDGPGREPVMKLVVGLGNPGRRYEKTRHNVGFDVLRHLAERHASGNVRRRFSGELLEARIAGQKVLLLSPTTYMNRSGRSVAEAARFYKLAPEHILVVCDDLNLPLGKLRLRAKGSPGGHNGLADIIRMLGSEAFPRLRIGIGSPPPGCDPARFVLARFQADEQSTVNEAVKQAADAVAIWVSEGIDASMNRYN